MNRRLGLLFLMVFHFTFVCTSSISNTPHKHGNKERLQDGVDHYEGGEHHSEFDHEAILGSVKAAEEYDSFTPEESKAKLAVLVKKMDQNADKFIDRNELKDWIIKSFKSLSAEESEDRFEDIDINGDDIISWGEYIKDTYGMEDESASQRNSDALPVEEEKLIADDKEMFEAADSNDDGYLNADEFLKFHSPEESLDMLPLILKQTLRDKDVNKDGVIDFQEFVGDTGKNHDKEWLLVEKDKFDHEFDKDKDGHLNHNEILAWIVPSNDEIALDEVNHLFAASDENHDDRLTYTEIIDNYEIFVGSEATDYGDLLNSHHFDDEL